jgi:hypothetical protein
MKFLRCKVCRGEVDIIGNDRSVNKKIKCLKCGFTNSTEPRGPEVFIIRKQNTFGGKFE